jgi:hypothetical protein
MSQRTYHDPLHGAIRLDRQDPAEALAIDLARDEGRLRALRSGIEAARIASPLFDGATKARQLESLFRRMWDRAVQALPAAHLPVED